jgi:hypothetical protein
MSCQILPELSEKAELSVERRKEVNDSNVIVGEGGEAVMFGTGDTVGGEVEELGIDAEETGVTAAPSCLSGLLVGGEEGISDVVVYLSKILCKFAWLRVD